MRKESDPKQIGEFLNAFQGNTVLKQEQQQEQLKNSLNVCYVRPFYNHEAVKFTMRNFGLFSENYNESLIAKNKPIHLQQQKVKHNIAGRKLSKTEISLLANFKNKHNKLYEGQKTEEYNIEVNKFNKQYGLVIPQKKYFKLTKDHDRAFYAFTYLYAGALTRQNSYDESLDINESTPLDAFHFNYKAAHKLRINKVLQFTCSLKTLKRYTYRLREAKAILNYTYTNSKKPVNFNINPELLVVFDHTQKQKTPIENQLVNYQRRTTLHNDSNPTLLKKVKKKEIVDNNFYKEQASPLSNNLDSSNADFYKNTTTLISEKNKPGKNIEVIHSLKISKNSQFLKSQLLGVIHLAKNLFNKKYSEYQPISKQQLKKEVMYGTLSVELFRLIIIQEILKFSAKIYKNSNVYEGEWINTIRFFENKLYNNSNNFTYTKEILFNELIEFKWRLNWVNRWYAERPDNTPSYPSIFFNPHLKKSTDFAFRFTKTKWNSHLKKVEKIEITDKKQKEAAAQKYFNQKQQKRADRAIKKFMKDPNYTQQELYNYFSNNLGADWLKKLPELQKKG